MSPLYLQDGKLLIQDGKLSTGQECCCGKECAPCPHTEEICFNISITDYDGNTQIFTQQDFLLPELNFWVIQHRFPSGALITLFVDCFQDPGMAVLVTAFWFVDGEPFGGEGIFYGDPCTSESDWWAGTIANDIPNDAGSFSVTFSEPPC